MRIFALFFVLHLICYAASRISTLSLFQTAIMIPPLAAGILIATQAGWLRLSISPPRYAALATIIALAYPFAIFSLVPAASLLNSIPDNWSSGDAMSYLGIAVLIVPAWIIAAVLYICLGSATGKWDPPVLCWMLGSAVACLLVSHVAAATPLLKSRGGFSSLAIPLTGAIWLGEIGVGLLRAAAPR